MVAKIKSGMVLPIASRAKAVQEAFREASTEVWYRCSGRRVRGTCPFAVRGCEGLGSPGVISECLSRRVGRGSECSVVASTTLTHGTNVGGLQKIC